MPQPFGAPSEPLHVILGHPQSRLEALSDARAPSDTQAVSRPSEAVKPSKRAGIAEKS